MHTYHISDQTLMLLFLLLLDCLHAAIQNDYYSRVASVKACEYQQVD